MTDASQHDSWASGDAYDDYIGRWSRQIAPLFLDWLGAGGNLRWLDVGCGTGAVSQVIAERYAPAELIGMDPNDAFRQCAERAVTHPRTRFLLGDAVALPVPDQDRDITVSGLMLNFVPERRRALQEMRRVTVAGGTVAFYVWDYSGGGLELLRAFWDAALEIDSAAREFSDGVRFSWCEPGFLASLAKEAGLSDVQATALVAPSIFRDFDDYWRPFTLGTGAAPGYYKSLGLAGREAIRARLESTLKRTEEGKIALTARAWAVKGRA